MNERGNKVHKRTHTNTYTHIHTHVCVYWFAHKVIKQKENTCYSHSHWEIDNKCLSFIDFASPTINKERNKSCRWAGTGMGRVEEKNKTQHLKTNKIKFSFFDDREMRNEANWQNAKWRRSKNAEDIKDTTKRRRETTTESRRRRRRGDRGDETRQPTKRAAT